MHWKLKYLTFLKNNCLILECLKSAPGELINKTLFFFIKEKENLVGGGRAAIQYINFMVILK